MLFSFVHRRRAEPIHTFDMIQYTIIAHLYVLILMGAPADNEVTYPIACSPVRACLLSVPLPNSNFRMIRDFSSIVLVDFLGQNELLVLQNPWESVKDCLPDVLDRKQYGV